MEAKLSRFEESYARQQQSAAMVRAIFRNPALGQQLVNPTPPAPPPPPPGPSDAEKRWSSFLARQLGSDPCKGEQLRSVLASFRAEGVNNLPDETWGSLLKG